MHKTKHNTETGLNFKVPSERLEVQGLIARRRDRILKFYPKNMRSREVKL